MFLLFVIVTLVLIRTLQSLSYSLFPRRRRNIHTEGKGRRRTRTEETVGPSSIGGSYQVVHTPFDPHTPQEVPLGRQEEGQ